MTENKQDPLEVPPGAVDERRRLRREGVRFDLVGFDRENC
jgi:hypothetical protein